jgi:hypothetical protein
MFKKAKKIISCIVEKCESMKKKIRSVGGGFYVGKESKILSP